jgi:hypothetical protein
MYLLLAGIYLHDIGMQCDVVRFPAIRTRAEKLGARFDIEFTARKSSDYSIGEQKALRRNHHYLSAAWIDHARHSSESGLSRAAQTIPTHLIADLMDVCKYHAKLPITECPLEFYLDSSGRKRLVAALLRFADELDVDYHRVKLDTVKNFRLDPRNAVYWWLHNLTSVSFPSRHLIEIFVRLNPDDFQSQGSCVHEIFVEESRRKNRMTVSVLWRNEILVGIDGTSGVKPLPHEDPLPREIVEELDAACRELIPSAEWVAAVPRIEEPEISEIPEDAIIEDSDREALAELRHKMDMLEIAQVYLRTLEVMEIEQGSSFSPKNRMELRQYQRRIDKLQKEVVYLRTRIRRENHSLAVDRIPPAT